MITLNEFVQAGAVAVSLIAGLLYFERRLARLEALVGQVLIMCRHCQNNAGGGD